MSELARFFGITVSIFFRDIGKHKKPHVHADYSGDAVSIAIKDGEVLEGKFPRPALHLLRQWLKDHREEVQAAWEIAVIGQHVGKIPLKTRKKGKR